MVLDLGANAEEEKEKQRVKPTRVILADDHPLIVQGIKPLLAENNCELLAGVQDGRELVDRAQKDRPDLIIVDVSMPLLNGIEAARQIRRMDGEIKFIFLSMYADADYVREAFRAGASGYVLKRSAIDELGMAIREVLSGRNYISPGITKEPADAFLNDGKPPVFGRALTARQREVLQLVAEGKQAKEIAAILNISVKTVEFHKASIMDSLGLRSVAELTRYAMEHGIIGSRS